MKKNRLRLLALVLAIVTMVTLIPAVSAENSVKNFTVNHYQQNIYDDNYTLVKTETKSGEVGTAVGDDLALDYTGFFALPYLKESTIASDGSTVIDIYYDRHYYLMTFDLDGGYGVEPIYARYGTPIAAPANPQRAGYVFAGWSTTIPETMPDNNITIQAKWTSPNSVNVNLVFWYENANDDDYTFVGTATTDVGYVEGKSVTPSQFQNVAFEGRDNYHFLFNAAKNEPVELNADGSTIVNVYFTRKTYRMIFFNCTIHDTNEDTDSCYPGREGALQIIKDKNITDCEDQPDSKGNQSWNISIYTRKWQEDVRSDWRDGIANRSNTRRWKPYYVEGEDGTVIYHGDKNVSIMHVMPDADIVFRFLTEGDSKCTMNYWVEPYTNESLAGKTTKTDAGITYILRDSYSTMMGGITENEEYIDIEGFEKVYTWEELDEKGYRRKVTGGFEADFFYSRDKYNLTYFSNGSQVRSEQVHVEALLNTVSNYDKAPAYPSTFEEGAYRFDGWYLSQNFADGTKMDWSSTRMPVGGMSVYANWVPVTHTITTYKTAELTEQLGTYSAYHGKTANAVPQEPSNGEYEFVGWFYRENGEEKAFDFESVPVYSDLTLYAKWVTNVPMEYTIVYKCGELEVAERSSGATLAGMTKQLTAKLGDQLYDGYGSVYTLAPGQAEEVDFTVALDETKNTYTFNYVEKSVTIQYVPVGPDGVNYGTVTTDEESVKVFTGAAAGSKPNPNEGFRFVGWYKDAECTVPVPDAWVTSDNTIKPEKTNNYASGTTKFGYTDCRYYAKFEYDITSLVIQKVVSNNENAEPGQVYLFKIVGPNVDMIVAINGSGSVTVDGLKVGSEYTVTELTDWSWRYELDTSIAGNTNSRKMLLQAKDNSVTFTNKINEENIYWLSGEHFLKNLFNQSTTTTN